MVMFRKFLLVFLVLFSIKASAQTGGFVNLNDFGAPTYPYQYSRFWLRSSVPPGSIGVIDLFGTSAAKFYADTFFIPKLGLRTDTIPTKLVGVSSDGMLRAFISTYLLPADTVNKWLSKTTIIPAAQVNSDWNSVSGISQILNKPTIPEAQIQSDWTQASTGAIDYIKNKPTIPTVKRTETYLGTSDGSGNYTVTYGTAFSVTPDIQPQLQSGTITQLVRITSSSTTGFTVQVTNRATVDLLGITLISGTSTVVSGSSVGVLVTAR